MTKLTISIAQYPLKFIFCIIRAELSLNLKLDWLDPGYQEHIYNRENGCELLFGSWWHF